MITLTCNQCQAHLEMDDAFAGGVCRCQYCGTIQHVPSQLKRRASHPGAEQSGGANGAPVATAAAVGVTPVAPPHPAAAGVAQRVGSGHVQAPPAPPAGPPAVPRASDDGLDALAEALGNGGPYRPSQAPPPPPAPVEYARPPRQHSNRNVIFFLAALGALLIVVVVAVVMFFVMARTVVVPVPAPRPTPPPGTTEEETYSDVVIPTTPHFLGIDLQNEPSVVYVIDRGSASAMLFDKLKWSMYRSLESLKPGQKFAVIFWDQEGEDPVQYPSGGLADVSAASIADVKEQFENLYAGGRPTAPDALKRAVELRPGAIVLVTGKAFELEDGLVDIAREAVAGNKGLQIHTVSLRNDDDNSVLTQIAKEANGQFKVLPRSDLDVYAE